MSTAVIATARLAHMRSTERFSESSQCLTGNPADVAASIEATLVPWLCVPGFRRVCPYTVSETRWTYRATYFIERYVP
jgi:hypothetical protein